MTDPGPTRAPPATPPGSLSPSEASSAASAETHHLRPWRGRARARARGVGPCVSGQDARGTSSCAEAAACARCRRVAPRTRAPRSFPGHGRNAALKRDIHRAVNDRPNDRPGHRWFRNAPVSAGSSSIAALLPSAESPPAAATIERSSRGGGQAWDALDIHFYDVDSLVHLASCIFYLP